MSIRQEQIDICPRQNEEVFLDYADRRVLEEYP
jgi:hypothetical protein